MIGKTYCIFSAHYLPNLGGVERYTYNLSKYLVRKGNRVIVVTSNTDNLKQHEVSEGVEIFRCDSLNLLKGRFPVLKYNRQTRQIINQIYERGIDYCIINTRFYLHSILGVIFSKSNRIPSIVIEHGTDHFTVNNNILDHFGHMYEHCITKIIKWFNKDFYGVSNSCNKWMEHFNISSKGTIYNSIDLEQINSIQKQESIDFRKINNIRDDDIIITYAGRLVREKGIEKLIEAFKLLQNDCNNCYLMIAGDGELYDSIASIKNKKIKILGKLDFNNIISLLSQSQIFCLPTDYPEGFPTSVLEAIACSCFVITTKNGGSKEILTSDDFGIILSKNDVEEIYLTMKNVIKNNTYRKKATEKSLEKLKKSYTWDKTSDRVIEIFRYREN